MLRRFNAYRFVLFVVLLLTLSLPSLAQKGGGSRGGGNPYAVPSYGAGGVAVRGYSRADGTYVRPYMRSAPDGNFYNNWSAAGNYNPYTGQPGSRVTPPGYASRAPYYDFAMDPVAAQMLSWVGHTSKELGERFGTPYKIHQQKQSTSFEYKDGNWRYEFFIDSGDRVYDVKYWGYDGLGGRALWAM